MTNSFSEQELSKQAFIETRVYRSKSLSKQEFIEARVYRNKSLSKQEFIGEKFLGTHIRGRTAFASDGKKSAKVKKNYRSKIRKSKKSKSRKRRESHPSRNTSQVG